MVVGQLLKAHCEHSLWRIRKKKRRHARQELVAAKRPQQWGGWNVTQLQAELSNITLPRCQSGSDEFGSFTGLHVFAFLYFLPKLASVVLIERATNRHGSHRKVFPWQQPAGFAAGSHPSIAVVAGEAQNAGVPNSWMCQTLPRL